MEKQELPNGFERLADEIIRLELHEEAVMKTRQFLIQRIFGSQPRSENGKA